MVFEESDSYRYYSEKVRGRVQLLSIYVKYLLVISQINLKRPTYSDSLGKDIFRPPLWKQSCRSKGST